jgi:hypothetical protein
VELVTLRLRRVGRSPNVELPQIAQAAGVPVRTVTLYDGSGRRGQAPAVGRPDLVDQSMAGPLLVLDAEATTFVPPTWVARGMPDGKVLLERHPV